MTDERRAWVPVMVHKDGGYWPCWWAAARTKAKAQQNVIDLTPCRTMREVEAAHVRMMRCTIEVPARKGKRR